MPVTNIVVSPRVISYLSEMEVLDEIDLENIWAEFESGNFLRATHQELFDMSLEMSTMFHNDLYSALQIMQADVREAHDEAVLIVRAQEGDSDWEL